MQAKPVSPTKEFTRNLFEISTATDKPRLETILDAYEKNIVVIGAEDPSAGKGVVGIVKGASSVLGKFVGSSRMANASGTDFFEYVGTVAPSDWVKISDKLGNMSMFAWVIEDIIRTLIKLEYKENAFQKFLSNSESAYKEKVRKLDEANVEVNRVMLKVKDDDLRVLKSECDAVMTNLQDVHDKAAGRLDALQRAANNRCEANLHQILLAQGVDKLELLEKRSSEEYSRVIKLMDETKATVSMLEAEKQKLSARLTAEQSAAKTQYEVRKTVMTEDHDKNIRAQESFSKRTLEVLKNDMDKLSAEEKQKIDNARNDAFTHMSIGMKFVDIMMQNMKAAGVPIDVQQTNKLFKWIVCAAAQRTDENRSHLHSWAMRLQQSMVGAIKQDSSAVSLLASLKDHIQAVQKTRTAVFEKLEKKDQNWITVFQEALAKEIMSQTDIVSPPVEFNYDSDVELVEDVAQSSSQGSAPLSVKLPSSSSTTSSSPTLNTPSVSSSIPVSEVGKEVSSTNPKATSPAQSSSTPEVSSSSPSLTPANSNEQSKPTVDPTSSPAKESISPNALATNPIVQQSSSSRSLSPSPAQASKKEHKRESKKPEVEKAARKAVAGEKPKMSYREAIWQIVRTKTAPKLKLIKAINEKIINNSMPMAVLGDVFADSDNLAGLTSNDRDSYPVQVFVRNLDPKSFTALANPDTDLAKFCVSLFQAAHSVKPEMADNSLDKIVINRSTTDAPEAGKFWQQFLEQQAKVLGEQSQLSIAS